MDANDEESNYRSASSRVAFSYGTRHVCMSGGIVDWYAISAIASVAVVNIDYQ
jgi:hypothetical protein